MDLEFPADPELGPSIQPRHMPLLLLNDIDAGGCPGIWPRSQFRTECTDGGHRLRRCDAVVTCASRNFEPQRGFHGCMRCRPAGRAGPGSLHRLARP